MPTVAKTPVKKEPVNRPWAERIKRAEKKGRFTADDILCAESWMHCAVGECNTNASIVNPNGDSPVHLWLINNNKSYSAKVPADVQTYDELGMLFYSAVRDSEIDTAIELFEKIQGIARPATAYIKGIN